MKYTVWYVPGGRDVDHIDADSITIVSEDYIFEDADKKILAIIPRCNVISILRG